MYAVLFSRDLHFFDILVVIFFTFSFKKLLFKLFGLFSILIQISIAINSQNIQFYSTIYSLGKNKSIKIVSVGKQESKVSKQEQRVDTEVNNVKLKQKSKLKSI